MLIFFVSSLCFRSLFLSSAKIACDTKAFWPSGFSSWVFLRSLFCYDPCRASKSTQFLVCFFVDFFFISTGSAFFLFSHYVIYFLRSLSVSEDIYSCKYRNWGTWQRGGEIKSGLVFLSHPSPS